MTAAPPARSTATPAPSGSSAPEHGTEERHVLSALVIDRPGTLNRIAGLFRARSFNIESLTVATTLEPGRSRMTIVVRGDEGHLRQVLAQLERLIEVLEVGDLTHAPHLELELALVEVDVPRNDAARRAIDEAVARAGGQVADRSEDAWRLSFTGRPDDVESALEQIRAHGIRAIVRAGSVAMPLQTPS
jgi:acetolactate synthase-1/3 small subunit